MAVCVMRHLHLQAGDSDISGRHVRAVVIERNLERK